jgi:hypothetical protein
MEGEFDVFGEPFSFGRANRVEMVGELKALRVLRCCDLRCVCSSAFADVAAHSDHPGEDAGARRGSEGQKWMLARRCPSTVSRCCSPLPPSTTIHAPPVRRAT